MKRILFRADAKPSIGIGDLVSLIQLSWYFEGKGWETYFAVRKTPAAQALVQRHDIQRVEFLPERCRLSDEIAFLNRFITGCRPDVLFFEITERPLREYSGLTEVPLKACICFDRELPADWDLVANWDVAAAGLYDQRRFPKTHFLLGPEYVVLPPSFDMAAAARRRRKPTVKTVLVAMGGADEFDFTSRVAAAFLDAPGGFNLHVVVGAGYEKREALESLLNASRCPCRLSVNVPDMFPHYMEADLAVGAGGLTSSELVATRTPAALVATYEHQIARCEYFARRGWARYWGFRSFSPKQVRQVLAEPPAPAPRGVFHPAAIKDAVEELHARHRH